MLIFGYVICWIAIAAAVPIFCSCIYLMFLTLTSLIPRKIKIKPEPSSKIAILIPAHNEEQIIEKSVRRVLMETDYNPDLFQIIVIADNCDDSTSYLASFAGARVLERANDWKKGKGCALEWTYNELKKENFDLFLILDADTHLEKMALRYLDAEFAEGHIAMQLPLKYGTVRKNWKEYLSEALTASRDFLQPRGRDRIGFSAAITGNACCFAKEILEHIPFEAGDCDDALEYNLKLVFSGEKVRFVCGKNASAVQSGDNSKIWKRDSKRLSRKYFAKLFKEIIKGNCTAIECFFHLFVPSIEMILLSLAVLLFTGGILSFADLPGCELLIKY